MSIFNGIVIKRDRGDGISHAYCFRQRTLEDIAADSNALRSGNMDLIMNLL